MVKPGSAYTGVLFDLDNTLVDRDAAFRRIANSLFESQPCIGERASRRFAVARIIELDERGRAGRDLLMERVLHGVRPIGESPVLGVAPAIANAVRDAVGVRVRSLPITAEKVREAMRDQAARGGP